MDEDDVLAGRSLEEAVESVLASDDSVGEATARSALRTITEDGIVRRAAVDEAVADASMALANAESRVEIAAAAFAEVEEIVPTAPDLAIVQSRRSGFESAIADLQQRTSTLADTLQTLPDTESGSLYEIAAGIERVTSEASTVHATAHDLRTDLESFQEWLTDSATRYRELERDIEVIDDSVARLADNVEQLADLADDPPADVDPGAVWLDLSVSHRLRELGLADARFELSQLDDWTAQPDRSGELDARLAELSDQLERVGERLDAVAEPAWLDRFEEEVAAIEATLATFEPPVDFGAVRDALDQHR